MLPAFPRAQDSVGVGAGVFTASVAYHEVTVLESYFFVLGYAEFIFLICLTFCVLFYGILFLPIPFLVFLSDCDLFLLLLFFKSTYKIPQ